MMRSTADLHLRGTLLSMAGMTVISPDGLLLKLISDTDVWTILLYRLGFLAVCLALWLGLRYRRRWFDIWRGIGVPGLVAIAGFTGSGLGFVGAMRHTSVADTLLIFATIPLWSALIGWLFIRERVRPRTLVAMVIAVCGVGFIVAGSASRGALLGDMIAVGTAFSQACALVALRKAGNRDMTPVLCAAGALAALISAPFASPLNTTAHDMTILLFLGLVLQPVALTLFASGARYIPAAEVALMAMVETVLGPIWAWLGIGETPGMNTLTGGAIVLFAIAVNNLLALRERPAAARIP